MIIDDKPSAVPCLLPSRIHEADAAGQTVDGVGFEHLVLPTTFDPRPTDGKWYFVDDGEPINPMHFLIDPSSAEGTMNAFPRRGREPWVDTTINGVPLEGLVGIHYDANPRPLLCRPLDGYSASGSCEIPREEMDNLFGRASMRLAEGVVVREGELVVLDADGAARRATSAHLKWATAAADWERAVSRYMMPRIDPYASDLVQRRKAKAERERARRLRRYRQAHRRKAR